MTKEKSYGFISFKNMAIAMLLLVLFGWVLLNNEMSHWAMFLWGMATTIGITLVGSAIAIIRYIIQEWE
jgi:hypothetical protein